MSALRLQPEATLPLSASLAILRATGEETRLRILALLGGGELSVSDLTDILGQSQPRISRHLKLLVDAGIVERHREGAWAFFRLADAPASRAVVTPILAGLDPTDPVVAGDRLRLADVRTQRADAAQAFFARVAPRWDSLRSLHAADASVEAAVLSLVGAEPIGSFLDLGTGTGRMLQILAPRANRAVGLDASHAMLAVARANLGRAGLSGIELRQGDVYAPPFGRDSFDLVLVHQVLHYLDDPARAISRAAGLLAPGGRLMIVDFAPHGLEFLREREGHRRLGFARDQVAGWLAEAGLGAVESRDLAPPSGGGDQLTVSIWVAADGRRRTDWPLAAATREVA